jgi:hypothetical protein
MFWSISTFEIQVIIFSSLSPMFWPIFNQGPPSAFQSIFLTEIFSFHLYPPNFSPLSTSLSFLSTDQDHGGQERARERYRGDR